MRSSSLLSCALVLGLVAGCANASQREWDALADDLPSCGDVVLDHAEPEITRAAPEAVECMEGALARGRSATLSVTMPTEEGDPIRSHFVLGADGRVTLYEDSTEDRFGDRGWRTVRCFEPDWLPAASCPA